MNCRRAFIAIASCCVVSLMSMGCQSSTVHGDDGTSITVTTPLSVNLKRGASALLAVGIDRERFTGAVTVTLSQLPDGVSAEDSSRRVETTATTFVLRASRTASLLQNHSIRITLEGANGQATEQVVALTVVE